MPGMSKSNEYVSNGVTISPSVPGAGDKVKIMYDGILSKNGANHIYAHVGYGSKWTDTKDVLMSKSSTGFEASVSVRNSDTLNLCFKDCANNWDNNSGKNYNFDITL